jgi:pyrimidine-specific ribonucleoside hydrolase
LRTNIFCISLLVLSLSLFAQAQKPIPIIFDSDMGPDYDDVGAIALLHAFEDEGEAKILATIASTKYECVACVFSVLNTYFKKPEIPVGVPGEKAVMLRDFQHWSDSLVANYQHQIKENSQAFPAVKLYRKILSVQPANSVTIVTTGFLTNLAALLRSNPDEFSSMSGSDLVKSKVGKLICMAGKFPSGYEFNVDKDIVASQYVFGNWPTNIIFSGFEIGDKIKVGLPLIQNNNIRNSPVKDVFRISIPMAKEDSSGRKSWDETAVLVAVKGVEPYYHLHFGTISVSNDGKNTWIDGSKRQAYLIESEDPQIVQNLINDKIMHQPAK